jgi:hypothetical protein
MADTLHNVATTQYNDYVNKLTRKIYRISEVAQNITVRGALLTSLYTLAAMENSSHNMADVLALLETLYNEDITPPSLIISGLEAEATANYNVAVTAGVNAITFPISLSSTSYSLFITSYTADGNFNTYKRSNKTTGGFTITVAQDGFIDYRAILA